MIKSHCVVGLLIVLLLASACTDASTEATPSGGMIFVKAEGKALMGISPEVRGYSEIRSLLGGAGHHDVSVEKWEEVEALIQEKYANTSPGNTERSPIFKPGMDPNAKDDIGKTLLHEAATSRRVDDVRRLIESGADVNAQIIDGNTPLHNAALNGGSDGAPEVVQLLIDAGANVNAVGYQGKTPLHLAFMFPGENTRQVVDLLLQAGASETIPDLDGKLPIDYARVNAPDLVSALSDIEASYEGVMSEKSSLDDWTLEEMADCAGTVEKLRPDTPTPEHADILFESCKAAVLLKQVETSTAVRERLSGSDRRELLAHVDTISKIDDSVDSLMADGVLDGREADWVCSVLPQWIGQVNKASEFIDSLNRGDLVGIKIDLLRLGMFASGSHSTCKDEESNATAQSSSATSGRVPASNSQSTAAATSVAAPDLAATVEASVQATVEAIPSSTPTRTPTDPPAPTATPDVGSIFQRAALLTERGEYDKAIAELDSVIELEPYRIEAYMRRGLLFSAKEDYDRAIADYSVAIEKYPGNAEAYLDRAIAHWSKGDDDNAHSDFEKAIILKPGHTEAYLQRGGVYILEGEYERAILDFDRVIELDPTNAQAFHMRGFAYAVHVQNFDKAIEDFDTVLHLEPDNAAAYYYRGVVHELRGDTDLAIADYRRTLELDPDLEEARQALESTESSR